MRPNYLPKGCDQQGRHPEAAHSASEYDDDPTGIAWGVFAWPLALLAIIGAVSLAVWMAKSWPLW